MREMRRRDREISESEVLELLARGEYGIMSTVDGDNKPYGVPLSYILEGGCIYFHSAAEGHKLDNIRGNNEVSFTVVGETKPVYDNDFSTFYESVIVFGRVGIVTDESEKRKVLALLCMKYLPEYKDFVAKSLKESLDITTVCKIEIERVTGKAKKRKI